MLEVGGGVGAIQVELLEAGAAEATNVELSPGYEDEAAALLREHGLEDRVHRRILDFAVAQDLLAPADVVVLHRVVCCYPDPGTLVGAAAVHARRRLVLSFPPRNAISRLVASAVNVYCAARRFEFRVYMHPLPVILAAAEGAGLSPAAQGRSGIWRYAAFERASG